MSHERRGALGLMMLVFVLACAAPAGAQMFVSTGRDTLRGLPGIEVVTEALPPELERGGLTTSALNAEVVGRLRAAGVTIYATQHDNPSSAKPYFYVHLNALEFQDGRLAVAVQMHLRQTLRSPVTDSNIVNAMTWDVHNVLSVPRGDRRLLTAALLEMVDSFIADWRAVH